MNAIFHSAALAKNNPPNSVHADAVFHNDEKGVYAAATGREGAEGKPTPAVILMEVISRNVDVIGSLLGDGEAEPDKAHVQQVMTQLFNKASVLIRKVHSVPDADIGALASGTILILSGRNAAVAHVGSTRGYLVRSGKVARLSRDHVADIPGNKDTATPGQLTRALGQLGAVKPDVACFKTQPDDLILLTSFGIHSTVSEAEMSEVSSMVESADRVAHALANLASRRTEYGTSLVVVDIELETIPAEVLEGTTAEEGGGPVQPLGAAAPAATPPAKTAPEAITDIEGHIKRHALFDGIPGNQVDGLVRLLSSVPYEAGHVLYEEGKPMTHLYFVVSGQVELSQSGKPGNTMDPGAFLCVTALIQGMQHTHTATIQSDAVVLSLTQMALAKQTVTDPQFAVQLYHNLARLLALAAQ
jgi:hypothetical protein